MPLGLGFHEKRKRRGSIDDVGENQTFDKNGCFLRRLTCNMSLFATLEGGLLQHRVLIRPSECLVHLPMVSLP